jgi:hypothetical protein
MSDKSRTYWVGIHGINRYKADMADVELVPADLHRAEVEALQAQLAERDRALAEWAEVSQRNYQRAIEAEERLAETRAGLGKIADCQDYRLPRPQDIARATLAKIDPKP